MAREYEKSHPYLTFQLDLHQFNIGDLLRLGACAERMVRVTEIPLPKELSESLQRIYTAKGIRGSTAIEGNQLTEQQVLQLIDGKLKVPDSRQYQQIEVQNILDASQEITSQVLTGMSKVSISQICRLNSLVLKDLELDPKIKPGKLRDMSVTVGSLYRAPPAVDCEFLLHRLVKWLEDFDRRDMRELEQRFPGIPNFKLLTGVLKATYAHLYLAFIHPFGDGNGRTSRLLEFQLMLESGAPVTVAHLFSNHYYQTIVQYHREMDSFHLQSPHLPNSFINYAVEGLLAELSQQAQEIRQFLAKMVWDVHVQNTFAQHKMTSRLERIRLLASSLPLDRSVLTKEIDGLGADLFKTYALLSSRTLERDIGNLEEMGLVVIEDDRISANLAAIRHKIPIRASSD